MVAKPQSMVLMKNSANAFAPAALRWVAWIGSTGGRSFGPVTFGPVVGTSAGTVGELGAVGLLGGMLFVGGVVVTGELLTELGGPVDGASPELSLQPATRHSAANAAIPTARRMTPTSCPMARDPENALWTARWAAGRTQPARECTVLNRGC